jgi:hypothetical protein
VAARGNALPAFKLKIRVLSLKRNEPDKIARLATY